MKTHFILLIWLSIICLATADNWRSLQRFCTYEYEEGTAGKFYDLRSLSLKSGYQSIKNGSDTFLINICSSRNNFKTADNTTACKSTSSICLINNDYPNGVELASLYQSQIEVNNTTLNPIMLFERENNGDQKCKNFRSVIKFVCNKTRALENKPTLESFQNGVDACTYIFEWKTIEACADPHTVIEPHYGNESLVFLIGDKKMDLDKIIVPQKIPTTYTNGENYDFIIKQKEYFNSNVSSNPYNADLTKCEGAFVCQLKADRSSFIRSIGKFTNTTLKHANESFHLIMFSNSKCGRVPNQNTAVVFNLYCDETINQTKTEFKAETNNCHYIFDVFSKDVCVYENLIKKAAKDGNSTAKPTVVTSSTTTPTPVVSSEKPKADDQKPKSDKKLTTAAPKQEDKKENNEASVEDPKASAAQAKNDGGSNTKLFGFIILMIVSIVGIVLAIFSLINDDRRSWLQKHLRRIKPQHTTSFHYSQVQSDSSRLVPLDSVQEE